MRPEGIVGIVLIAAGILGLLFAGGPGWDRTGWDDQGWGGPPWGGQGWGGPGWRGPGSGWCPMHGPWSGPWSGPGRAGQALPPVAGARAVEVAATDFTFSPAEITVKAGEAVNIQLANRGAVVHDLYLPATGLWVLAQPGQTATVGLRLTQPGTYQFYCTVPGHAAAGMVGRVVVTP